MNFDSDISTTKRKKRGKYAVYATFDGIVDQYLYYQNLLLNIGNFNNFDLVFKFDVKSLDEAELSINYA